MAERGRVRCGAVRGALLGAPRRLRAVMLSSASPSYVSLKSVASEVWASFRVILHVGLAPAGLKVYLAAEHQQDCCPVCASTSQSRVTCCLVSGHTVNRMRKHSDPDVAGLAKDVYTEWRASIKHHANRPSIEVRSDPKTEAFRKNARKLLCEALDLEVVCIFTSITSCS